MSAMPEASDRYALVVTGRQHRPWPGCGAQGALHLSQEQREGSQDTRVSDPQHPFWRGILQVPSELQRMGYPLNDLCNALAAVPAIVLEIVRPGRERTGIDICPGAPFPASEIHLPQAGPYLQGQVRPQGLQGVGELPASQ